MEKQPSPKIRQREERLAEALKRNLARRKARERALARPEEPAPDPDEAG